MSASIQYLVLNGDESYRARLGAATRTLRSCSRRGLSIASPQTGSSALMTNSTYAFGLPVIADP